jgi:hypothetical protein
MAARWPAGAATAPNWQTAANVAAILSIPIIHFSAIKEAP